VSDVLGTDDSLEFVVEVRAGELRAPVDAIECFDPHAQRGVITLARG
jgi:hypothetical protein